jgi:HK97 family phage portal protein
MRLFSKVAHLAPSRIRAAAGDPFARMYSGYYPVDWGSRLSTAGITVTPDLSMTLAAMYGGVMMAARDLATLPPHVLEVSEDGDKERVRPSFTGRGIAGLAYMLRWQPNAYQTATEFLVSHVAQYILREWCFAEIVTDQNGFITQLLPRHPDRVVKTERLPSGRLRYGLRESDGTIRWVLQDEMHVVRGLSWDGGLSVVSRTSYGAEAIGTALAAGQAAAKFFKSGMTAAKIATVKGGEMDEKDEEKLHASISRFAAGVDNSFGLALIPDDVTITNLGVEPEKAQMMLAQEWGVRQVALLLGMPGSKLGIRDAKGYGSQIQDAVDYVINCLRTIAVPFEQAFQRDLIFAKDRFIIEFKLEALLRGDPAAQAQYIESLVKSRVIRPSEARNILNMNKDAQLDRLSEQDFRPGSSGNESNRGGDQRRKRSDDDAPTSSQRALSDRLAFHALLAVHDNALRCIRRERAAVSKLATKHADNPDGWVTALQSYFTDHAQFVSQTMRVNPTVARDYAAQRGTELATRGMTVYQGADDGWEKVDAEELAALSLELTEAA